MSYTGNHEFQEQLRKTLSQDINAPPGKRRTAAAIVRAVNAYLVLTKREAEVIKMVENTEHYIRNFVKGESWNGDREKALIWDFYLFEKALIVISRQNVSNENLSRILEYSFQRSGADRKPLNKLLGQFLIYKRAIKDPDHLVVRGLIEFIPLGPDVAQVKEVHINRSHLDRTKSKDHAAEAEEECWTGTLLPRERSYCLIMNEVKKGTPRMFVLEQLHENDGQIISLCGDSVECVEGWGKVSTLASGVYLERLNDVIEKARDDARIDLVSVRELRKSNEYVLPRLGFK